VRDITGAIGRVSSKAYILVISNPINSTVPILASTLAKAGVYDPKRAFDVTTLDIVRAAHSTPALASTYLDNTPITIVGGHSGATIVPLLSQSAHGKVIKGEVSEKLMHRIQSDGDEVIKAKDGARSATLSMAYAGTKFANAVLPGLNDERRVITPTFVEGPLFKDQGIDFFSSVVNSAYVSTVVVGSLLAHGDMFASTGPWCREDFPAGTIVNGRAEASGSFVSPNSRRTLRREGFLFGLR